METPLRTESPSKRGYLLWILAGLLLALALPSLVERIQYAATRGAEEARADVARANLGKLSDTTEAFRLVSEIVGPSVVHINTVRVTKQRVPLDAYGFWTGDRYLESQGQGSGVIVDATGYVITNNHVIEGAGRIEVKLSDGRTIDRVTLVGADPLMDLAVLKIEADKLSAATWGNSSELQVGDWVLAIGSPYGLDHTVTAGIISAKQRRVGSGDRALEFLQTDAAVNPGNSGGPLVNLQGQVVGITTAIIGPAYQGISFAIPSDVARDVFERLRKGAGVQRGWIGIKVANVTPQIAQQVGLATTRGAFVVGVAPNSPSAKAGIAAGDVIASWNGETINEPGDLILLSGQTEVGKTVDVILVRSGQEIVVKVQVAAAPTQSRSRAGGR